MQLNLRVKNNALAMGHNPLVTFKERTRLAADAAAGVTSFTVENIDGFTINQILLVGEFGDDTTEIVKTHAATAPTGSTVTLTGADRFDHYLDTALTVLDYDQVVFYRVATNVAPVPGVASPLATVSIQPGKPETTYNDLTNSTGYAFACFKNSILGTYSAVSIGVPYTGNPFNSVEAIVMPAVTLCGESLDSDFCEEEDLIEDANEAQRAVESMRDWSFELAFDSSSVETVAGETSYDVTSLSPSMKYPDSKQGIITLTIGNRTLDYIDIQEMNDAQQWSNQGTLSADATVGATSITMTNSSSLQDSGSVLLRGNGYVAYTANDTSTGILSGISATAITVLVPSGATVWQNMEDGTPYRYCMYDGAILLDRPPDSTNAGIPFKIRYLSRLPALTSFASTTPIPFPEVMQYFVAQRIQLRKKNHDEAQKFLDLFTAHANLQSNRHKLQVGETFKYYVLNNTAKVVINEDMNLL